MPQLQLPFFPEGATEINPNLAFIRRNNQVIYIYGHLPIFTHDVDDLQTFRMYISQLYVSGNATQSEIAKAFGVSKISIKRAVKLYKKSGISGFFSGRETRGPAVLTPPVLEQAQKLFDEGLELSEVAKKLGIKKNTLYKAVKAKRLYSSQKKERNESSESPVEKTKSDRSIEDSQALIGMGATNTLGRVAASIGEMNGVDPKFELSMDVPNGGVLLSLPALLSIGLLSHTEKYFQLPKGYYRLDSIFLLLSFLALARVKTIEDLRFVSPGEWGELLGLDRIPEAKTLREKIGILSNNNNPSQWGAELSRDWMEFEAENSAILYIDGHVRVYHGEQTKLPKHYVARQKLCLRATVDYWVNAMDGQPFFMINKAIDPGLLKVLEEEIIPRLEKDVPGQPTKEQLENDPFLNRFTIIFDREGYSPEFMKKMKEKRIACLTYHKYPGDKWDEQEFIPRQVTLASGNVVEMKLAERGTLLGNIIWVREIRKLTESGHQTAVISTDYRANPEPSAAAMFARWSQENFFKYMRQHFNLDRLIDYSTEEIPDTTKVVNPEYRKLDMKVRKMVSTLNHRRAKFAAITLKGDIEPKEMEDFQQKKGEIQEEINHLDEEITMLKEKRKRTEKHISVAELPEEERFSRLSTQSKYLIDTIKMIAYRAETAMANVLREMMSRPNEARSLLRGIFSTEADIIPDYNAGLLTVRLHDLANRKSSELISNLCDQMNETETVFPGTNLKLVYGLVSNQNP